MNYPDGPPRPPGGAALSTTAPGSRTMAMPQPASPMPRPAMPHPAAPAPLGAPAMPRPAPRVLEMPRPAPAPAQAPAASPPRPQGTQKLLPELTACFPAKGVIASYMDWVHRLTHAPPQTHLASILPVIAYEANRRRFTLANGEPLHIWSFIIVPSGAGKTTAVRYARDLHDDWCKATRGQAWKTAWESAEGSLPGVAEALVRNHHDEAAGSTNAIIHHSEISKMMRGDDALEWFCQLFDRGDLKRNLRYIQKRQDDGEEVEDTIKNAKISGVFTTTRANFQEVFRDAAMRGGFASRLLWFTGSVTAEQLMPMQLVDEAGRAQVLRDFIDWTSVLDGVTLSAGNGDRIVHLTAQAQKIHSDYFDELRPLIVDASEEWSSLANRASIYALRLSALYALVSGRATIQSEDITCAITLMRYLFRGLRQMLPALRPEDRYQKKARAIVEVLRSYAARGSFQVPRAILLRETSVSAAEFDVIARTLLESDQMREVTVNAAIGRPAKHYALVRGAEDE